MAKKIFFSFLAIFLLLKTYGQKDTAYTEVKKYLKVAPKSQYRLDKILPYSSIEIIDERFDTSKLGYTSEKGLYLVQRIKETFSDPYKKLITELPFKDVIKNFLNSSYEKNLDKKEEQKLLIAIKKLWMSEIPSEELENNKMAQTMNPQVEITLVHALMEIYSRKNDTYTPLIRIDTIFESKDKLNKDADELIIKPFHNALVKVSNLNVEKIMTNRKGLSWSEVISFNQKRFEYPRIKNDITTKGIYLSFKDFLNNSPTQKNFTIQFDDLTDEVTINENGRQNVLEKYWGVCDGEKTFIKLGLNLFELTRTGNTYETRGSRTIMKMHGSPTSNAFNREFVKAKLILRPLQLDMDTGNLY